MESNEEEIIYFGDKYCFLYPCTGLFCSYKNEYIHQDEINKESISESLKYADDLSYIKPEYKDFYIPAIPETQIHFINKNLKEDEKVKKNINNTIINKLSKSYNDINIIKLAKEETDNNNRLPQPLSNRLNLSMVSNEPIEKDKIKESSSKKGALKILELIASKRKEKEEIDKKKEELMIETFQKATNNNFGEYFKSFL